MLQNVETEERVQAGSTGWEVSGKENILPGLFCFLWDLDWGGGGISFPEVEGHESGRDS